MNERSEDANLERIACIRWHPVVYQMQFDYKTKNKLKYKNGMSNIICINHIRTSISLILLRGKNLFKKWI